MEEVREFELLRVLSYLVVPLVLAWLLPILDGGRAYSLRSRRLRQLVMALPAVLAVGYTILFFQYDAREDRQLALGKALPPLPGIVWCLFIVYLANFLSDKYVAADRALVPGTRSLPLGAWIALGVAWLVMAAGTFAFLPSQPSSTGYIVLALGAVVIVCGPAILSKLSGQAVAQGDSTGASAQAEASTSLSWQVFVVIGIVAFGKIALVAIMTLEGAAMLQGDLVATGQYTGLILVIMALYMVTFLLFLQEHDKLIGSACNPDLYGTVDSKNAGR